MTNRRQFIERLIVGGAGALMASRLGEARGLAAAPNQPKIQVATAADTGPHQGPGVSEAGLQRHKVWRKR